MRKESAKSIRVVTEAVEIAERFDYRKISIEVERLVKELLEALQNNRIRLVDKIKELFRKKQKGEFTQKERYPQVSSRVFDFLTEYLEKLPPQEIKVILFYLLTSTSPKDQDEILDSLLYFKENFELEKISLIRRLFLFEILVE
jgi:predicted secreted protein